MHNFGVYIRLGMIVFMASRVNKVYEKNPK